MNEMTGLSFIPEKSSGPLAVTKGEQVLESIGYGASTIQHALLAQTAIIVFNYCFTYCMLLLQRPSAEPLYPSVEENEDNGNGKEQKSSAKKMNSGDKEKARLTVSSGVKLPLVRVPGSKKF